MSDYLIFLSETISAETGRDFDTISAEIMRGEHGTLAELVETYGFVEEVL